jgi:hypothetical protein
MNLRFGTGLLVAVSVCLGVAWPTAAVAQEEEEEPRHFWDSSPNIGLGLFQSVSLAPFSSFRLGFGPKLPSSLAEDGIEVRINEDWARMLSVQEPWLLDYDVLRSNIGVSYGITRDLRVDLDFESGTRTTGYLETFIIAFHRTFGLALGNRREYQDHPQTIIIIPPNGGQTVEIDQHDPQPYARSILASMEWAFLRGDDWVPDIQVSTTFGGAVRSGDITSGSPIDVGGSLSFAKSAGPLNFYLAGSAAWFGNEKLAGLTLRPLQWSALFGFEVRPLSWFSITAQYLLTSGGADGLGDLSRPSNEITAGFKWDLGRGYLLETAIIENVINPYNSPDFGVHLSLTMRW